MKQFNVKLNIFMYNILNRKIGYNKKNELSDVMKFNVLFLVRQHKYQYNFYNLKICGPTEILTTHTWGFLGLSKILK